MDHPPRGPENRVGFLFSTWESSSAGLPTLTCILTTALGPASGLCWLSYWWVWLKDPCPLPALLKVPAIEGKWVTLCVLLGMFGTNNLFFLYMCWSVSAKGNFIASVLPVVQESCHPALSLFPSFHLPFQSRPHHTCLPLLANSKIPGTLFGSTGSFFIWNILT